MSCKTELSQALKRTALEKGFAISDNQGEGNCMFFALSEQLDLIKGIQMCHDELRRTIVQHLRENPRLVSVLFRFFLGWVHLPHMRRLSRLPVEVSEIPYTRCVFDFFFALAHKNPEMIEIR